MLDAALIDRHMMAANSKLAVFLRSKEDEEAVLQIGKGKIKEQAREEARRGGGPRGAFKQPADFSVPLPPSGRPRTADGRTSFHFNGSSVTTTPTSGSKSPSSAPEHALYVEREGAVEIAPATVHAGYVEREDAVEVSGRPLVWMQPYDASWHRQGRLCDPQLLIQSMPLLILRSSSR